MSETVLNGYMAQGAQADNGTATTTVPGIPNQRLFVTKLHADYSATVAGIRNILLKFGPLAKLTIRWDFSKGDFDWNLPVALKGLHGDSAEVQLDASGTGGITGRSAFSYFVR